MMTRLPSTKLNTSPDNPSSFYCYIVQCADGSYYTGWSTNPQQREESHNRGQGARYTRARRPVALVYIEPQPDRSTAMKREAHIKTMTREKKQQLIDQDQGEREDA